MLEVLFEHNSFLIKEKNHTDNSLFEIYPKVNIISAWIALPRKSNMSFELLSVYINCKTVAERSINRDIKKAV